MLARIAFLLSWPARRLIGLERTGRVVWSLAAVDGLVLGLWLHALNRLIFHRELDQQDFMAVIAVGLGANAVCLQYGLRRGAPPWRWVAKAALGVVLGAMLLRAAANPLEVNLSGKEIFKLFAGFLPLLLLIRLGYLAFRRALPWAPLECVRWALLPAAVVSLYGPRLLTSGGSLSGDGYWYCVMLGDFVTQLRAGIFPIFAGQSLLGFNGAVSPLRLAPALQYLAGGVDLLTGRSLPLHALQNLTLVAAALLGIVSAYLCLAAILPRRRWIALLLAMAYISCPGALALGYQGDLFMSMTTLPVVPVAVYGAWRTLRDRNTSVAWTALPVAAAWYCHPPIALWLTLVIGVAELIAGLPRWRDPALYRRWGRGLALFLLAGGYAFVSVATLRLPRAVASVDVILESIRNAYPGMFLPLSDNFDSLGNYQLGWTLLGVALLALIGWACRPRRAEGALLLGIAGLLFLLLPIPGVNEPVWRALPAAVRDITYHWPMERFYVIMAALTVTAAAGTLAKFDPRRPGWSALLGAGLFLGLSWSAAEATVFPLHLDATLGPIPAVPPPEPLLEPENLILTRYAFSAFSQVPPYYSHGYIDPYLENRILAADRRTEIGGNVAAVRGGGAQAAAVSAVYDGDRVEVLSPSLTLQPGFRYAVHLAGAPPVGSGTLTAAGPAVDRRYFLPDSAMGMLHGEPTSSFGYTPTSRDFFPVWFTRDAPEKISLRYIFDAKPERPPPPVFGRISATPYRIDALPVRVTSWTPYRAETETAAANAWLETPRIFLEGYAATVNGRPAPVARSAGGLVAVGLQPGKNTVVLTYPGPWPLRLAFWTAFATWLGTAAVLVRRARRGWSRAAAHG